MGTLKRSTMVAFALLLVQVLPLYAQAPAMKELPKFFGSFSSTVGGWSEYTVTEAEGVKKSTMRNSIVGKEGDAFWYEVAITEGGVRNVIKMFLKGDPNNPENIQRLIMKNGDQPAQEMPREFVLLGRRMATSMFESRTGTSVTDQPGIKTEVLGNAQVTVPAGTFAATNNRILDSSGKVLATFDFNRDILPFGILRSETGKVKMELVKFGKDAVSVITEEPVMMKTPPGMSDSNPRGMPPGMEMPGKAPATGGYGSPAPAAPAAGGYGK